MIEFAELDEFADLKLKNYSSGMLVRLAFSVMMEADADVLLIDEVLAVGDAAFQQKCADAFHAMKARGKTIVLVTHEMATVEEYCHRAMLIDDGHIRQLGDPAETGREYLKLNFERGVETGDAGRGRRAPKGRACVDCWLEDAAGERVDDDRARRGDPPAGRDRGRARGDRARGRLRDRQRRRARRSSSSAPTSRPPTAPTLVPAGTRTLVKAKLENPLAPGRHFVHCGVQSNRGGGVHVYVHNALDFVVFGTVGTKGIVSIEHEIEATVETEGKP